jgi:hypothetical protein
MISKSCARNKGKIKHYLAASIAVASEPDDVACVWKWMGTSPAASVDVNAHMLVWLLRQRMGWIRFFKKKIVRGLEYNSTTTQQATTPSQKRPPRTTTHLPRITNALFADSFWCRVALNITRISKIAQSTQHLATHITTHRESHQLTVPLRVALASLPYPWLRLCALLSSWSPLQALFFFLMPKFKEIERFRAMWAPEVVSLDRIGRMWRLDSFSVALKLELELELRVRSGYLCSTGYCTL